MASLPDWVAKHKKKGMAVEKRGDSYYLSRVTSVWNPVKKRAQKKSLEYLGVITPEGIIPPKGKRETKLGGVLDAGNFVYLKHFAKQIIGPLSEAFPDKWQSIMAAAANKLCYQDPFKRMKNRHDTSFSRKLWPKASLSKNSLTNLLVHLGEQWPAQLEFFNKMAEGEKHMAIDLSHIFSDSKKIPWIEYGHNGDDVWRPQLEILLMWGTTTHKPVFMKLLPGATHSAQSLLNTIWETGLRDTVVVVDKGFWSKDNIALFENANIHYAMPLKRGLSFLEYRAHSQYKDYFRYRKEVQWYRTITIDGRTIYIYLDKAIANQEESSYLRDVEEGKATKTNYNKIKKRFGTMALITDTGLSAEETYLLYKERREVEYAFDTLQNTLHADVTWMSSRESMQGYLFIQFVALHLYSQILDHLKRKKLLNKYSVQDVLTYLSKVCVVDINGQYRLSEVNRQSRKMIDLLEVPITKRLGS